MNSSPYLYLIIVFIGVISTFFANNSLQKKLIIVKNREKAIDLLFNDLEAFKSLCIKYWNNSTHDNGCSLEIKIKYIQLRSFISFTHSKYSLQNKQLIDTNFLKLFNESTGDEFDSAKRTHPRTDKITNISKLSNTLALELLKNKI